MPQDILPPEDTSEQLLFNQAVEAIRQEKFSQARENLTNLLRTDQQNPEYWVWLSAAMETQKERLYCLQTAYKMDPTNSAARRGLILLGGLPADETVRPFPMNHPSPWEAKVKLTEDKDKPTGLKKLTSSPSFRLGAILGVGAMLLIGSFIAVSVFNKARPTQVTQEIVGTPRPTVTPYSTDSDAGTEAATEVGLAELLSTPYTPTPIYAATPHGDVAADSYHGAMRAYKNGQWDLVGIMMAQVATAQPGSADAMFFIGEANRLSGKYPEALSAYNAAIAVNSNFAPSYLGRARVNFILTPTKNILDDLTRAVTLDPNFAEAYIERGNYFYTVKKDWKASQSDLERAISLNDSPLAELTLARVFLAQNQNDAALQAASKANQLDITMLDAYLVMGMAYRASGNIDKAVSVLETYLKYKPDNAEAYAILGAAYYTRGDFSTAQKDLQQGVQLDPKNFDANYWYGQVYLAQQDYDNAMTYFRAAQQLDPASFDAGEGVASVYVAQKQFNNSYIAILKVEQYTQNDPARRARFLFVRAESLTQLKQVDPALRDWNELISLPDTAVTADMRQKAQDAIASLSSPTPSATFTLTPSPTVPTPTRVPSQTPRPTSTRFPTVTPTP